MLADRLLAELGVTPKRLQELFRLPHPQIQQELEKLKQEARVLYRRAVFRYHPDRNPDDPYAGKILKALGEVIRHVEGLEVRRSEPPPTVPRYVQEDVSPGTAPFQANPQAPKPQYDATRVVFIRVP